MRSQSDAVCVYEQIIFFGWSLNSDVIVSINGSKLHWHYLFDLSDFSSVFESNDSQVLCTKVFLSLSLSNHKTNHKVTSISVLADKLLDD